MTRMDDFHMLDGDVPELAWLGRAACADLGVERLDLFFVDAGHTIAPSTVALCARCPVRRECLVHAYRLEITSGYFGGMSPGRRRAVRLEDAISEIERPSADDAS